MEVKIPLKDAIKIIEKAYGIKNAKLMKKDSYDKADRELWDDPEFVTGTAVSKKYKPIAVVRHKRKRSVVRSHNRAKTKRK